MPHRSAFHLGAHVLGFLVSVGAASALDPSIPISKYASRNLRRGDGLPVDSVGAIAQTRDGYLWLATEEGLARYDGMSFTVFDRRTTPELGVNDIAELLAGKDGRLWIGTLGGGLVSYRDGLFQREASRMPSDRIQALLEGRDGVLWIGTNGGGLCCLKGGSLTVFSAREGLPARSITFVAEDQGGRIWVGSVDQGVFRFQSGRFVPVPYAKKPRELIVHVLHTCNDGSVLVGTEGGLIRLRGDTVTRYHTTDGLPSDNVWALLVQADGTVWVGTRSGGLARIAQRRVEAYTQRQGLPADSVSCFHEDREGSLWVGLMNGGVVQLLDPKFTTYSTKDGLGSDDVFSIYEDHSGDIWVGTWGGGVSRIGGGSVKTYRKRDGLLSDNVLDLHEDSRGGLWVGTDQGLSLIRSAEVVRKGGPAEIMDVAAIAEDGDGTLWVGTDGDGLYKLSSGRVERITEENGLANNRVSSILPGRHGALWLGTFGGGLSLLSGGRFTNLSTKQGLSSDFVWSMYLDGDGALWIGTDSGGLNRYRAGKFTVYTTEQGLLDNVVFRIMEDDQGYLWMTSNHGISRVSKRDLNAVALGEQTSVVYTTFGRSDGLLTGECNGGSQTAGWKTRDGILWFPTAAGVAAIDPSKISTNRVPPPLAFQGAIVDGSRVEPGSGLTLTPGAQRLELQYAALTFRGHERVKYRYRLVGYDSSWVDAGSSSSAHYTRLPPGHYAFQLTACNADGVWNDQGATLSITALPHFYETYWFYSACLVAASLAVWGAYALRIRRMKARFLAVLSERQRIARELHDTVSQGLTAISIQLDAIEHDGGATQGARTEQIERGRQLVSRSLTELRRSVADLRSTSLDRRHLGEALREIASDASSGSHISVGLTVLGSVRSLPQRVETNLLRIAQEATTNAIKHSGAVSVAIRIEYLPREVRLSISDDGRGFDGAAMKEPARGHFGLVGMRERARVIGGELTVSSRPGAGTQIGVVVTTGRP